MLLDFIRKDLGKLGIPVLYLVTGHTGFYEKYGWRFVTMAMGDDQQPLRLYQSPAFHRPRLRFALTSARISDFSAFHDLGFFLEHSHQFLHQPSLLAG